MILALLAVLAGIGLAVLVPQLLEHAAIALSLAARGGVELLSVYADAPAAGAVAEVHLVLALGAGVLAPGVAAMGLVAIAQASRAVQRLGVAALLLVALSSLAFASLGEALALVGVAVVATVLVVVAGTLLRGGLHLLAGALATVGVVLAARGGETGGAALVLWMERYPAPEGLWMGTVLLCAALPLVVIVGAVLRR